MNPQTTDSTEIRLPTGFRFAGVHSGIKETAKDLAIIACDAPSTAAGVYTQNLVRAASIDWNRQITPSSIAAGIVINSGNANACTGGQGHRDNQQMAATAAEALGCEADQVLVLSTGVIGQSLPMDCVDPGIRQAASSAGNKTTDFLDAADAIMTTDRFRKTCFRAFSCGDSSGVITGMAKGAGMIGPNMATMLSILVTDCYLSPQDADHLLRKAVNVSFNCISVEGHTSTNDAVLLLSSSQGTPLREAGQVAAFEAALTETCVDLARQIPADGEGASHVIEIRIDGAKTDTDADRIARTIAQSALVKTAFTGADPNWGRIVSAAGYSGVEFDLAETALTLNGHTVFESGQPAPFDPAAVSQDLRQNRDAQVVLSVGQGPGRATHWTSDLTVDYVRLNSEYTT
ncbi:MAG: bifunctional glutamate N-acetyltransferase/amino-acid acetyltransferase ArgJ [Mariniblastus sp.]|nr:bifunctional glutamate N-acetyltransferase/amino-acid acetyltransferase ArgJ [Mariniblastus sp.]